MPSKKAKERMANTYRGRRSPLPPDHIGHMDLKVGVIRDVIPNPKASHKYFIVTINFGAIFSDVVGAMLVHHYEEEELINQKVVCCCNIYPVWSRGMDSYTNMLVALSPEFGSKMELLSPPKTAEPGDIISVVDFPRNPDRPYIDPNSNIFDKIAENTRIDESGQVLFKSKPWVIENKPGAGFVHTNRVTNGFLRVV